MAPGEGSTTDELDDTTTITETRYYFDIPKSITKFCVSLYYNAACLYSFL